MATLAAQKTRILAAQSREELQRAQPWLTDLSATADLPANYGLPPYHYRCRTVTVAYFPELSAAGKPVSWSDDQGQTRQDKILFSHVDGKLGRELLLTEGGLNHAHNEARHPIPRQKLEAALRSITHKGESNGQHGRENELVTLSQNGVVLVFRNNLVYTAYIPTRDPWQYFKDQVKQPLKKGDDDGPEGSD